MRIDKICIREIEIPFIQRVEHALAARETTESVILEFHSADGVVGYGEATPRSYVTGEDIQSTISALHKHARNIFSTDLSEISDQLTIRTFLSTVFENGGLHELNARCACEMALWDLVAKMSHKSILDYWPEQKTEEIYYSAVLPIGSASSTLRMLERIKEIRFRDVKIKANNSIEETKKSVLQARSLLGDEVKIRLDANAAWTLEESISYISVFNEIGVWSFEQPMPASLNNQYPVLREQIAPLNLIFLDESVCTYDDALLSIEKRSAHGFVLKIAKHGGLLETQRILDLANHNGIACQLSCHVGETSLLTQAGKVFAAVNDQLLAYEGAYGTNLLSYDIVDEPIEFGFSGKLLLDDLGKRAGWNLQINSQLLEKASKSQYIIAS